MRKRIFKAIMNMLGWKLQGNQPKDHPKYVIVAGPHTSNWDYIYALMGFQVYGMKARYLIKNDWDFFPVSLLIKWTGGLPIDRSRAHNVAKDLQSLSAKHDELAILFTPEGTRKWAKKWKTGFHRVALATGLPVVMASCDYRTKTIALSPPYFMTEDLNADLRRMEEYYKPITPKYPEQFNPELYERE